ncbi:MAG: hypothetical protein WA630_01735, partial [Mycobacterium sp.]
QRQPCRLAPRSKVTAFVRIVHDGLLTTLEDGEARPATFDNLYPAELRQRVLAAESSPIATSVR